MEYTLKRKEANTLRLTIDDNNYQIPLAGSLNPTKAVQLNTPEGTIAFFNEYLPKEVAQTLTIDDYNAITEAWKAASAKASGKTPGES